MKQIIGLALLVMPVTNFSFGSMLTAPPRWVRGAVRIVKPSDTEKRGCARQIAERDIASSYGVGPQPVLSVMAGGSSPPILQSQGYLILGERKTVGGTISSAAFGRVRDRAVLGLWPNQIGTVERGVYQPLASIGEERSGTIRQLELTDGDSKALFIQDGVAKLFCLTTNRLESFGMDIPPGVTSAAGTITGKYFAFFYYDQTSFIYARNRNRRVYLERPDYSGSVVLSTFTQNGAKLVGFSNDGTIHGWRATDGALIHRIITRHGQIAAYELSGDGRFLAISYQDGNFEVRDAASLQLLWYADLLAPYESIQFRSDSIHIRRASNSGIQQLTIWPQPGTSP